jgi:hypothetical protein
VPHKRRSRVKPGGARAEQRLGAEEGDAIATYEPASQGSGLWTGGAIAASCPAAWATAEQGPACRRGDGEQRWRRKGERCARD